LWWAIACLVFLSAIVLLFKSEGFSRRATVVIDANGTARLGGVLPLKNKTVRDLALRTVSQLNGGTASIAAPQAAISNVTATYAAMRKAGITSVVLQTESRIIGTVRNVAGVPAAGVRVTFYPGHYPGASQYTEVKTDAKGRYEIIPQRKFSGGGEWFIGLINPTNSIFARDFGKNLAAVQEFDGTTTNINLTLQPAITLSGSVKNIKGVPVKDAVVELRFLSGKAIVLLEPLPIKVNELGSFSVPALPQGREYFAWGVSAKGYGSASKHVEAKNTQTSTYEFPTFVLKLADRKLAGQVVGGDGKPLAGAHVSFAGQGQPQNSSTKTDSQGNFAFDAVCDGPIKIFAHYQDPFDSSIQMSLNPGGGMEAQAGNTNILIQLRDTSISAWDVPTLTTTGTVFDPSGRASSGVSLSVWHSANPFKSFWSDGNGKYRVRWQRPLGIPPDWPSAKVRSVLVARDPAHNLVTTQDLDETTTNLDLHLQSGCTLSGSVQDEDGRPLTNAIVSLDFSLNARAELARSQVDASGSFSFNSLPHEGEYFLEVKAIGYGSATTTADYATKYATPSCSFLLPPFKLTRANLQLAR
jgi:hypothetical protein